MSRIAKAIENPEVPGLESMLPPPPPPPPPPIISKSGTRHQKASDALLRSKMTKKKAPEVIVDTTESTLGAIPQVARTIANFSNTSESTTLFAGNSQLPFFVQPSLPQVTASEQPWWIPTDSDTMDVVPTNGPWIDQSASWTDGQQKIASPGVKPKPKFIKRKSEAIDPAQDAERVASAQKELSSMMKPLKCDLCNAVMNSTLQAKLHYEGKPHQKKVSMFLNQNAKKIKPDDGQVTSTTPSGSDWDTYCDACKTWFTSQIDANQHYAGKKHIRATTGVTRPKAKRVSSRSNVDHTGPLGMAMAFLTESQMKNRTAPAEASIVQPVVEILTPTAVTDYPIAGWPVPTFRCDPCGVVANRLEQLETHKRGSRHLKMLSTGGIVVKEPEEVIESTLQPTIPIIDYSIYRTPSGQYYCAPCNRSFHSENSFAQHVDSKKHKTQVNPKQSVPTPVVTKKTNKSTK